MKAVLGVVSLLVALAVLGLVAVKQLRAVGHSAAPATAQSGRPAAPQMSGSGTVREQALQVQNKVADGVAQTMGQAAAVHKEEADKP